MRFSGTLTEQLDLQARVQIEDSLDPLDAGGDAFGVLPAQVLPHALHLTEQLGLEILLQRSGVDLHPEPLGITEDAFELLDGAGRLHPLHEVGVSAPARRAGRGIRRWGASSPGGCSRGDGTRPWRA